MTTKASTVFLKDGGTSYTISLDALDMALLPIDKLLNKYSGNQQTAIWSLDTYCKEFEYLDKWDDKFSEFEVEAEKTTKKKSRKKKAGPVKNCIYCHICQMNVPETHISEHNDSRGHSAMLKMSSKALDRINKHIVQEKYSFINVQKEKQSCYYCATCNMFVDLSNTNHHNEIEHLTSLKTEKLHVKIYEIYERLGGKQSNGLEIIEDQVEDVTEKTEIKVTRESRGQNVEPTNEEKRQGNEQSNVKIGKPSEPYYCSVCDIYVPNNENNLKAHDNGKTHKSKIVRNEKLNIERASENSSAVLFSKSHAAICNEVGTASATNETRNDTIARSIQITVNCDDDIYEAVVEAMNMFDDVINLPIKISNQRVCMMVKWWSWHGLNIADDFHVSGNITCGLCQGNFPFEDIYVHVMQLCMDCTLPPTQHTLWLSDGSLRWHDKRAFCVVCNTYVNSFKDHLVSYLHTINRTRAILRAREDPALSIFRKFHEMLSSKRLNFIKPHLQRYCGYQRAEYKTFYEMNKCKETIQINTKPMQSVELSKMNFHGLELQLIQFQRVVRCLLCKEDVIAEHASSHMSSRKHLDRVEIPFAHEENCLRTVQYPKNMVVYHCGHCNVILMSKSELHQHLISEIHLEHLQDSVFEFQLDCGEWKSRADIRRMEESDIRRMKEAQKKEEEVFKIKCLSLLGFLAFLAYKLLSNNVNDDTTVSS